MSDTRGADFMTAIFIDGEAGTTGLGIRHRLQAQPVTVLRISSETRKDPAARQQMMAQSDLTILCLPDDAARHAVALAAELGQRAPKILDASTAYRTDPAWVYGFPELAPTQPSAIAGARLVSNPGCYATGAIALLRPLVDGGLLPPDHPISINAVSGYSGGGRAMIEAHEKSGGPAFELYALGLNHKHIPEIALHAGLAEAPIFVPSVGHFAQGMIVSIPLHLETLPGKPALADLRAALASHYVDSDQVAVVDAPDRLEPQGLNDTDRLELAVAANGRHAVLLARLDNLGKGASGAAVRNARLMLGIG